MRVKLFRTNRSSLTLKNDLWQQGLGLHRWPSASLTGTVLMPML
jgi:hypothetical protein